jgi:hypothetical protein
MLYYCLFGNQINKWLRDNKYPTLPLPTICNYIPLVRGLYEPLLSHNADMRDKKVLEQVAN